MQSLRSDAHCGCGLLHLAGFLIQERARELMRQAARVDGLVLVRLPMSTAAGSAKDPPQFTHELEQLVTTNPNVGVTRQCLCCGAYRVVAALR